MIQSMTGFGTAEHVENGATWIVELRSVNHRYLKLSVRLPETCQFAEAAVERILRERLTRGSVTYSLRVHGSDNAAVATMNLTVLQAYADQLGRVRLPDSVRGTIDLAQLAQLPGVTDMPELDDETRRIQLGIIEQVTHRAIDDLSRMRREEGQALRAALNESLAGTRERLDVVAQRAPLTIVEYHERLHTRVAQLVREGGYELGAENLAREVALYAERCDVAEEITRLRSHLDQFVELCDRAEPVGRTLDFLSQELLREANTIASKSNDALIARHIVEIKGLIDRVKEQVQNIE